MHADIILVICNNLWPLGVEDKSCQCVNWKLVGNGKDRNR